MKRETVPPQKTEPPKKRDITLADWWRSMARYEGQRPLKRPPDLVVP